MKKVTVIIPCYNEEAGIGDVIRGFPEEQMLARGYTLEVLVIDNNSADNTSAVARAAGARVIFEGAQGKGHAIRTGFRSVSPDTDYVVMLDGDHTYEPTEILRMIEPLESGFSNVIIGSRLSGRMAFGSMKSFNRLGNWIYSHLVRIVYRVSVTDVLTGYFAWTREVVEKMHPHLKSPGFAIEMEMITKLARLGEPIFSVPISYHARAGASSLHPVRDGLRILRMFAKNLTWRAKPAPMRRIAFVSDAIFPYNHGGKERRLYEVSRRLADAQNEIHIYTMKWWDGPKVIKQDGVYLHAISKLYPLYKGDTRSTKEAVMFGLATFKLMFEKFDALDVDSMPFFPLFSARIVTWLRRRPLYATWHEVTDLASWQAYLGRFSGLVAWCIERLSMRAADTLVSVSRQTSQRLRANVMKPVVTVPLGVDLQGIYKIRPSVMTSDVIFVGRLVAHKNVDLLLRALARLKTDYPGISAKIIGNGPEKPRLAQLVQDLGLQDNVALLGTVESDADLYSLMKASKMFVLPSVREGFSVVAVEANAAGIPVVTTNHPDNAARELITPGVNGYLVDPNPISIAEGIQAVLDESSVMTPGQQVDDYDWDRVAENVKNALVT